eukprot:5914746-Amphidinium_carterae.1
MSSLLFMFTPRTQRRHLKRKPNDSKAIQSETLENSRTIRHKSLERYRQGRIPKRYAAKLKNEQFAALARLVRNQ